MNVPHYRRNYKTGAENLEALDILNIVLIAGLNRLAKRGEFETLGDLFEEVDFLLNENGLTTCKNEQTQEAKENQKTFYMLIDNHTDQIFRTKSGRIKKFKTPDDASEYMQDTINNLNMRIVDQDEGPVSGW